MVEKEKPEEEEEEEAEEEPAEETEEPPKKAGGLTGWIMGAVDDNVASLTEGGRKAAPKLSEEEKIVMSKTAELASDGEEEEPAKEEPKKKTGGITGWFYNQMTDNVATMTEEGRKDFVDVAAKAVKPPPEEPNATPEAANVKQKIDFFEDQAAKNKPAPRHRPPPPRPPPPARPGAVKPVPKVSFTGGKEFTYASDWDENGLLYFMGTNFGTEEQWQNPHDLKLVIVKMESIAYSAPPAAAVSRTKARLRTKQRHNPWMKLDIGMNRHFIPNRYTIRHGGHADEAPLRNWVLEGSKNDKQWTSLKTHENDEALKGEYGSASWEVEGVTEGYRFFRIKDMTKHPVQLTIGGFELYGKLLPMKGQAPEA